MANMAEGGDNTRQEASPSSHPASKKPKPRTQTPEQLVGPSSKKSHKRFAAFGGSKVSGQAARDQSPDHTAPAKEPSDIPPVEYSAPSVEETDESRTALELLVKDTSPPAKSQPSDSDSPSSTSASSTSTSSTSTSSTSSTGYANESEDSSGSSETVTHVSPVRRDSSGKPAIARLKRYSNGKPNALTFLDLDSPQVTSESIQRTVKEASRLSPGIAKNASPSSHGVSSASSGTREDVFDVFSSHETDQSTSPEHSIDGDPRGRVPDEVGSRAVRIAKGKRPSYGSPETPRANVQHLHIPSEDLSGGVTPRAPNQHFVKYPPRVEKPPLTGYELLASRLSAMSAEGGGFLRPIYRRFEALNHRMLLHLQDEICELEEQLHRLDTADTQNRRLPKGIRPASRRAEFMSGSELQWHKTDILGKIGWKLEQYNRVLSSFRETLSLPAPTLNDISQYRGFLLNYSPISEVETQFLDSTDDLVCLGDSDEDVAADEEEIVTPVSRSDIADFHARRRVSILSQSDISRRHDERSTPSPNREGPPPDPHTTNKHLLMRLSVAMAVAVILPIFTFLVIPGFIGRMTVVCLVGIGIVATLVQGGVIKLQATQEFCVSAGLYGGVMAVLAGMVN
ncbi:hypothetical protein NUW58_g9017 [Xylaria curta]|uniref:Uncharacterized protein n=1 Tax=Xylaria curta TaxID=42375 RepID=A0ACC1N1I9_9PEZI|nr:hypothetical protein NUW58_g9017 [Xylaria curta]